MTDRVPDGRPVAMVLGGTSPHIAVIEKLKALGYFTVLLDYKAAPPAAAVADRHLQLSTLDHKAVLEAARQWQAVALVNVCLDQPVPVMAWVCERLGLPRVIDVDLAHLVTNKDAMKQRLQASGLHTAGWAMLARPEQADDITLRFPVVAKPVAGTGSLGVVFARDAAALKALLPHTFNHAGEAGVLVEEFIDGIELSVDCIVVGGATQVLLLRERHKTALAEGTEATCHATLAPARIDAAARADVEQAARDIAKGFALRDGVMLIQGILDAEGRFVVLEVAARLGGGPGASRVVQLKTGFDYVQASIDQQLGRPVTVRIQDSGFVYGANNLYASAGTFAEITGLEEARSQGLIEEYYVYRTPGEIIPERLSGRSRISALALKAKTPEELKLKVEHIMEIVDVRDIQGHSILRRDIGLHRSI